MGRSGAGKTSMHSIIFANLPGYFYNFINYFDLARDTISIGFTVDINESKIRFMGNL